MKTTRCFKRASIISSLSACLASVFPAFGATSWIVDIDTHTFAKMEQEVIPVGINDRGQVAGSYSDGFHAFITGPNGKGISDLGSLGGGISSAADINNAGQVVGSSRTASGDRHAFITGPNGQGMTDIGVLNTGSFMAQSYATGVNDAGQVVGTSPTMMFEDYVPAFVTGPNGTGMTKFGNADSVQRSPTAINAAGQIVGYFYTPSGEYTSSGERHGFIAGPDTSDLTDLGTLGGNSSTTTDINNSGQVIGESTTKTGDHHAFITGANGMGMIDLGTLGGNYSEALGINDAGQVVGNSFTAAGVKHAFVTGPNGVGMMDLNSLVSLPAGVILNDAEGINNHGQIIALSDISVVPEPETYAMVLAGLGLVSFVVSRRKTT